MHEIVVFLSFNLLNLLEVIYVQEPELLLVEWVILLNQVDNFMK